MRFLLVGLVILSTSKMTLAQGLVLLGKLPEPKQLTPEATKKLDRYFDRFCDYTGGLGIGFDPVHTYEYAYRQQLKKTQDPELKRFFVLKNLFIEMNFDLDEYQKSVKRVGKTEYQPLTTEEKAQAKKKFLEKLSDLEAFGDQETARWTKELREAMDKPKANNEFLK